MASHPGGVKEVEAPVPKVVVSREAANIKGELVGLEPCDLPSCNIGLAEMRIGNGWPARHVSVIDTGPDYEIYRRREDGEITRMVPVNMTV